MRAAELCGEGRRLQYIGRKFYVQLKGQHAEGRIRQIERVANDRVKLTLRDAKWAVFGAPTREHRMLTLVLSPEEQIMMCGDELQSCSRDEQVVIEEVDDNLLPFKQPKAPLRAVNA